MTYIRDVAHVRDGYPPQTNMVRVDGRRAILQNVLKTGNASTIDIIRDVYKIIPQAQASLPGSLSIKPLSDQSVFVRAAISGVIREGVIAAGLTGLLILLFLGSWRSTLIITISIPLSILASIVCLSWLGETINIMTLGGLALAVGILVDDATVTIENINYHLEQGKDVEAAILDGARQIALPALVSTLSICIVFVPMFLLAGIAKFLFIPLAEAVVFAMLASYLLSRTLVPTLAKFWLRRHDARQEPGSQRIRPDAGRIRAGLQRMREGYRRLLAAALDSGPRFAAIFLASMAATALLAFPLGPLPGLGQDFFPSVDGGTDQAAPARAHRHPHRGDRGALRSNRGDHPRRHSGRRDHQRRRQHRTALQRHQPRLQHLGAGGPGRCGHFREPVPGPCADGGLRPQAARSAERPPTHPSILPSCRPT